MHVHYYNLEFSEEKEYHKMINSKTKKGYQGIDQPFVIAPEFDMPSVEVQEDAPEETPSENAIFDFPGIVGHKIRCIRFRRIDKRCQAVHVLIVKAVRQKKLFLLLDHSQ